MGLRVLLSALCPGPTWKTFGDFSPDGGSRGEAGGKWATSLNRGVQTRVGSFLVGAGGAGKSRPPRPGDEGSMRGRLKSGGRRRQAGLDVRVLCPFSPSRCMGGLRAGLRAGGRLPTSLGVRSTMTLPLFATRQRLLCPSWPSEVESCEAVH